MINLKLGKNYINRLGEVVKILKFDSSNEHYQFNCKNHGYTSNGKFYHYEEYSDYDLIAEVADDIENDNFEVSFLGVRGFATKNKTHYIATFPNPTRTLMFDLNRKLYGFDSENLLEIIKEEYQVLYRNNHGIYNTTTTKVTNMKEAIGIIEYNNQLYANPKKVVGLIDKNGNIIYNNKENV